MTQISRFTAFRRQLSHRGTHELGVARNPDDEAQYEGVVFSDGKCVIHWLTKANSINIYDSLQQALTVHGHPEYGTDIVWHDGDMPHEWDQMLVSHAEKRQNEFHHAGLTDVTLCTERDEHGKLVSLYLHTPATLDSMMEVIYPVGAT